MKFSTKEDLEMSIEEVFAMLSDFDNFEKAALRRGAEVSRVDPAHPEEVGLSWNAVVKIRGKMREFEITLTKFDAPNELRYASKSGGMDGTFLIELVALSRKRTRMRMDLDMRPKTLSARLLMQSARLARNTLNRRYKTRIAHFAEDMEERHKRVLRKMG
jgi:carbon monoxide dehydrogenase subunit G